MIKFCAFYQPPTQIHCRLRKKMKSKRPVTFPDFKTGQIWRMKDSQVHIGLTGKTLVHYKHYKGGTHRAPVSLAGKGVLEKYLIENKAVLVQGTPSPAAAKAVQPA